MKNEILKFELGEKLGHQLKVEFHEESNGDSRDALKQCLNPEVGRKSLLELNMENLKFELGEKLKTTELG